MANATNKTCALAFQLYRLARRSPGADASRDAINEVLARSEREPISKKTHDYCRREFEAGLTTWVPINQFNVLLEMQKTLATMGAS